MTADATPSTPPHGSPPSDDRTRSLSAADLTPTAAPTAADLPEQVARYRIEGEIARGGMGVVFRATDPDFGRTLAVKVLLDHRRDDEAAVRRFLDEARLCGQLQHPGIPPVHEMGTLPDGRPFFAMKLVKGDTLATLLAGRATPCEDLPRFVGIFDQVCQTVAYAHSRGVIHRDLKPANIMVGAFGEVQVMDWGLAKILREPAAATVTAAASTLHTTHQPTPEETAPGSVLGTPAFMPPEQARGQTSHLDERADVFSLGAVLCAILTGHPPHRGSEGSAVLRQAAEGDLGEARARLAASGADEELVRLTLSCLAFQPSERPRDVDAVAKAVAAYRAGVEERLKRAELARAGAEVRVREERKRRQVLLGLAATVLLLVLTGGAAAWLLQQQHAAAVARRTQADGETGQLLKSAHRLLADGREHKDLHKLAEARAEAARAVDIARSGGASAVMLEEAIAFQTEATEEEEHARKETKERRERAERNRILVRDLLDVSAPREVRTYTSEDPGRIGAAVEPSIDEQYAAAFYRWGKLDVDRGTEAEVAARLQQEPEAVVQEVLAALDNWMLRRKQKQLNGPWTRLYRVAELLDHNPRSRQLRRLVVGKVPARAEAVAGLLGAWPPWPALWELTKGQRWRPLLELRGQADPAKEPVLTLLLLARASEELGDAAGAEALLREAVAARPEQVVLLTSLGQLLNRRGREAEAVEYFRAARALRPQLGVSLALALARAGRGSEAEEILAEMVGRQPNNPELYFYLGNVLGEQKKKAEAAAAYYKAIHLKDDYAEAHYNLGVILVHLKKPNEAETACRRAMDLNSNLHGAYFNLGVVLKVQGKTAEAVAAYREAISRDPNDFEAHYNLGLALLDLEKPVEAVPVLRKAIDLRPSHRTMYYNFGVALAGAKKLDEAVAAYRKATEVVPDDDAAYNNLGDTLLRLNRPDEALAALRKAIDLRPDRPAAYHNLGAALRVLRRPAEAEAALRKAIALDPDDAVAYSNLGAVLHDQEEAAGGGGGLSQGHRSQNQSCRCLQQPRRGPARDEKAEGGGGGLPQGDRPGTEFRPCALQPLRRARRPRQAGGSGGRRAQGHRDRPPIPQCPPRPWPGPVHHGPVRRGPGQHPALSRPPSPGPSGAPAGRAAIAAVQSPPRAGGESVRGPQRRGKTQGRRRVLGPGRGVQDQAAARRCRPLLRRRLHPGANECRRRALRPPLRRRLFRRTGRGRLRRQRADRAGRPGAVASAGASLAAGRPRRLANPRSRRQPARRRRRRRPAAPLAD
jgi:serine/threonine-protein kinase